MEDNGDREDRGTVQYWLEVLRIGSLLFGDINSEEEALKSLITSIIETPLLSEIECLTGNGKNGDFTAPFTAWLLQGLLKAASSPELEHSKTFYLQAQTKLLLSAYHGNVLVFEKLLILYVEALESILKVKVFNAELKFLLPKDYELIKYEKSLTALSFQLRNKRDQVDFILILIQILNSVKHLVLYHCTGIHSLLWDIVAVLMECKHKDIKYAILPFLDDMLCSLDLPSDANVLKRVFLSMPSLLCDSTLPGNEACQQHLLSAWNSLKKAVTISSKGLESIIRDILETESLYPIKNYVLDELSYLFAQLSDFEKVSVILLHYKQNMQIHDKIYLLMDTVVSQLEAHLRSEEQLLEHSHGHLPNKISVLSVTSISRSWNSILSLYNFMLQNSDSETCRFRLDNFHHLVKACCKILGKLEVDLQLSKFNVQISFFDNSFSQLLDKILEDFSLIKCQYDQAFEVTLETLSGLLNLPEAQSLPSGVFKNCLEFLLQHFERGQFQYARYSNPNSLKNSEIPALFLKSLQRLPAGVSVESCITIFSRCASDSQHDLRLAIQAVKSVPFLFLTRKTSPSRLITDILLPAALTDLDDLHTVLIDATVNLTCALAGTSCVSRDQDGVLTLTCCECSSYCRPNCTRGITLVEPHLLKLVAQIASQRTKAYRQLLDALPRLSMHMFGLKSRPILEQFLLLLSNEDNELRYQLAKSITSIVFGRPWVVRCASDRMSEEEVLYLNMKGSAKDKEIDEANVLTALDMTLTKLEDNIHLSLSTNEYAYMQHSLLETLTNVACFPMKKVLSKCIRLLLMYIGQPNAPIADIVLQVAAAHRTTPLVLYFSLKPEVNLFLGSLIVTNRLRHNLPLRSTLSEVITVFKGLNEGRFASESEKHVIPVLILWVAKYPKLEELLNEWCDFVSTTKEVVLSRSFQSIYTYILLSQPQKVFEDSMLFVERITEIKTPELILRSQKLIVNQLLFNYHREPYKVLWALKNVIGLDSNCSKEMIADGLESRFVGYLLFIVSKFVKEVSADSEKIHAIRSLSAVIKLMGTKHITPIARKVLATLQTTLTFNEREYFDIHCETWKVFVNTIDVNELGPLLATIVVCVLPFLEHLPDDVGKIFNYLIVENKKAVEKFLPSITFLTKHSLPNQVIRTLERYSSISKEETLKDRLVRETNLALHETVGVRVEGLKALLSTIKSSQEIQNLIIGSDEPDPCVTTLLDGLILCCSDSDQSVSMLAASCLGQLGAIDPGLLPRKPKAKNVLPLSVHDLEFAFLALTEMARGFQNARSSVDMDAFAIAIQELIKMYEITPTADNRMWSRFPKQTQSLMTPMLTSRYKVQAPTRTTWPDVIFGSSDANIQASTHVGWASFWASKLISYCKDDRAVILFKVCEPSLKRDAKVLLFFLQYILLHAIIRGPSVHKVISQEIEAVINWSPHNVEQDDMRAKSRPVRLVDYCGYPNMRSTITSSDAQACAMTIFLLLDFLHSWLRMYRAENSTPTGDHLNKRDYVLVRDFLDSVNYLKFSSANYEIREYPRAIMYLEDVIAKRPNDLCTHLPLLSKAYALHGDLDSVAGASTFQKTAPKMEDLLLNHQVSGQVEEMRIIYERLGKDGLMTPAHMQEMVQCYLNLGEPFAAHNYILSVTTQQPDLMSIMSEGMAESLLKLGDYSQLSKWLEKEDIPHQGDWFEELGRILLKLRIDKRDEVVSDLANARVDVANALKQTGLQCGDYQQGYSYLVKLQILNELERVTEILSNHQESGDGLVLVQELTDEWAHRGAVVQSDPIFLEPLMSIRRIFLSLMKEKLPVTIKPFLDAEIGKYWVKSAEIARKARCLHQAYNYILNAEQYNVPSTFIEKAQLFWDKGDQDLCLFTLSRGIGEFFPDAANMKKLADNERLEERKMCAEAKLLYAAYSETTSNCDQDTNMTNYQDAFDVCRALEKTEAFLAQCLDRVLGQLDSSEQNSARAHDLRLLMVQHFGKSLTHGCEYIYQTVPRMLSIWLDMGEKLDTPEKSNAMTKINRLIQNYMERLPAFVLMTALPQLLSRLGHPNREVFLLLKSILVHLMNAFPQQCFWAVQAVAKSSVSERVKRYNEVIQDRSLRTSGLSKLITDFTNLCDKLSRLTNRSLPHETAFRGLKVSGLVRELPQLLTSEKFSAIIIPITRFCSISLPRNVASASHEPFPKAAVYITGIEEDVTVLQSLQRPRKISFRGSDGKLYDILCKPTDDLRRDGRLMEFNNIVNMFLHRDPDSRARGLHIRTYVVTPLGESGGLIEWVPNLVGFRSAVVKLYKQFGKSVSGKEVRRHECQVRDSLEKKRNIFLTRLLPMHPPIFSEWFRLTFPDPYGWYVARQSYIRTTAVMSMVGYILGLGDRHGENILFDTETGDTVHVDFNCLFNKGERLDWKERVPFRLTHNMVAAMGPCGVEGTYRKSCEISLRVLRSQAKTLMSVLTPFAYDPSGSWGKNKEIVSNERDQKIGEACIELNDIEKRLNGSLRVNGKNTNIYLSVEGQARSLITKATDIDNLCQMFIGWAGYM